MIAAMRTGTYAFSPRETLIHDEVFADDSLEHDADHGNANEYCDGCCVAFEVTARRRLRLGERSFDDPVFGQDFESNRAGSLHDLQFPGFGVPDGECQQTSAR